MTVGLWNTLRQRSAAKEEKAGAEAYAKAIAAGASEQEAKAASEQAARRNRRRRRILLSGAGHG